MVLVIVVVVVVLLLRLTLLLILIIMNKLEKNMDGRVPGHRGGVFATDCRSGKGGIETGGGLGRGDEGKRPLELY